MAFPLAAKAHTTSSGLAHETMLLDSRQLRTTFSNGLSITIEPTRIDGVYTCKLSYSGTYSADSLGFSLYNLGIQSRIADVVIKVEKGGVLPKFKNHMGNEQGLGANSVITVPKTGVKSMKGKLTPPDPDGVWFITFNGDCILTVTSKRVRKGHSTIVFPSPVADPDKKKAAKEDANNHESVPPPPEPGGEN